MISVFGRLTGVLLLVYLLIAFVVAMADEERSVAITYAGFSLATMLTLQLDTLIGHAREIRNELRRVGHRG